MPNTTPNGPSDTASFATSNLTGITISAVREVSGSNFKPGASDITITGKPGAAYIISGAGISTASGTCRRLPVKLMVVLHQALRLRIVRAPEREPFFLPSAVTYFSWILPRLNKQ